MTDSIFLLRCVDCDAQGQLSRLWLRTSIEVGGGRHAELQHYVECMNCGAHLKSHQHDRMETVDDDEWSRIVDGPMGAEGPPPIA
jgi:Zn ribbon nucleic-acid-binding protein